VKNSKKIILISSVILLTGCSSVNLSSLTSSKNPDPRDYNSYTRAQIEIAKTAASTEAARIQALADIAKSGSDVSKIIATQAIEKTVPIKIEVLPPAPSKK